jgi:hypothetical protein
MFHKLNQKLKKPNRLCNPGVYIILMAEAL